jgi:uncharacterized protein with PQ loop repeat
VSTADVIGWTGALTGGFMTAIQYVRARRVGVDGISPLTWSLFLMMGIFWMAYGIEEHSACMVVGTIMVAPVQAAILLTLGWKETWRSMGLALITVILTILLPTVIWGWNVGAGSIGVVMVFTRLPQIIDLLRLPSVEGVSVMSWLLSSVNLGLWLYYYLVHHDTGAAISMVITIASNLLITVLAARRHHHTSELLDSFKVKLSNLTTSK